MTLTDLTPATQFHIDHLKGQTVQQIRENWKAGHYTGICPKWAAFYAKHYGLTLGRG